MRTRTGSSGTTGSTVRLSVFRSDRVTRPSYEESAPAGPNAERDGSLSHQRPHGADIVPPAVWSVRPRSLPAAQPPPGGPGTGPDPGSPLYSGRCAAGPP